MQIIPVIDLMGGRVVRAQAGNRASYQPLLTPLSATSEALDVVAGLLRLHAFSTLYVADLDAIMHVGHHGAYLAKLAETFPNVELWLDSGVATIAAAETLLRNSNTRLVIGSESQADAALAITLVDHPRVILSLDYRGDTFVGPAQLLAPHNWPRRLIVMTLAQVGSGAGPDLERLTTIMRDAGDREVYAAGGLRDVADVPSLARLGVKGILVASSLHDGRLSADDLAALQEG